MGQSETFHLQRGTDDDLDMLSELSKQLNDEFYPHVNMSVDELRVNINNLIHTNHEVFLFKVGSMVAGYTLVLKQTNPLNIQQFYMVKEARGKGYNNLAILLLKEATGVQSIEADSLVWKAAVGSM